jgi:hypothetical protein
VAASLAALEARYPPKRWFDLTDVLAEMPKGTRAAEPAAQEADGASAEDLGAALGRFYDELDGRHLVFPPITSQVAELLATVERARGAR